jgi:hypothetical protein
VLDGELDGDRGRGARQRPPRGGARRGRGRGAVTSTGPQTGSSPETFTEKTSMGLWMGSSPGTTSTEEEQMRHACSG